MKSALLFISMLLITIACYCQNDCSKELEFKNIIKLTSTGNTFQDVHNWFVSENGKQVTASDSWDANIVFIYNGAPVKLGAGANSGDYQKLVEAIKTGNKLVFSYNFIDYVYKEILKPDAYKLWTACNKEKQKTGNEIEWVQSNIDVERINLEKGLIGLITDETDETFILKLKWQGGPGKKFVKILPPIVKGVAYMQGLLDLNKEITSDYVSIPFYRMKTNEISIKINTVGNVGMFATTLQTTATTYNKAFTFSDKLDKNKETFISGPKSWITLQGDYVFKPDILLIKNNSTDKIEKTIIAATINIKITGAIKGRDDVPTGPTSDTDDRFYFTKEEKAFVDSNLNKEFIITFKAIGLNAFRTSNKIEEGCSYRIISCNKKLVTGGNEFQNCQDLLDINISYKKIRNNSNELPCRLIINIKNLGDFEVNPKL